MYVRAHCSQHVCARPTKPGIIFRKRQIKWAGPSRVRRVYLRRPKAPITDHNKLTLHCNCTQPQTEASCELPQRTARNQGGAGNIVSIAKTSTFNDIYRYYTNDYRTCILPVLLDTPLENGLDRNWDFQILNLFLMPYEHHLNIPFIIARQMGHK